MDQKEFSSRRKRLMQTMGRGTIAIIPTAPVRVRNRDSEYPYRPDSDFHYLTGFPEPEAVAVFIPGRKEGQYVLFCRERDQHAEIWHGRRAGLRGACETFSADHAYPITELDAVLPELLEHCGRVFYTLGHNAEFDQRVVGWVNRLRQKGRSGVHTPGEFVALDHVLHDMRLFKSKAEIRTMRRAANISALAHVQAMRACRPGLFEYQVEAELLHTFRQHGCVPAYNSIVGGGANSCILHYNENNMPLNDGELLLIDAAAEYEFYASDITRTFPVNGCFSPEQKAIYELVLAAQYAAIEKVKPGNLWSAPHEAAVKVLTYGLVKLGLLKGKPAQLIEDQSYRRFYMHRTGHWLGMDVHDVGEYKFGDHWRALESGMVLTVEPGLYISAGSKGIAKKWWNIGVRIEDDVLVTPTGHEVLSAAAPKSVADIEALMTR
ncbi:MAG: Xaa-Pro aminopeptidase [Gammaproteobacteria bacterium]|nr:Xaa-Pro aminopeptidase [Gammaproteobacteria bacterium]